MDQFPKRARKAQVYGAVQRDAPLRNSWGFNSPKSRFPGF